MHELLLANHTDESSAFTTQLDCQRHGAHPETPENATVLSLESSATQLIGKSPKAGIAWKTPPAVIEGLKTVCSLDYPAFQASARPGPNKERHQHFGHSTCHFLIHSFQAIREYSASDICSCIFTTKADVPTESDAHFLARSTT